MKRLIAKKITAYNKAAEQFIQECKDCGKFDDYQMKQIYEGFENGLTIDKVKVYADLEEVKMYDYDPKFNADQMEEIRLGFQNRLKMEEVQIYAYPEFYWAQMAEIRKGLESKKLTIEQVKLYVNVLLSAKQMEKIREDFENGRRLTEEEIKDIINKKNYLLNKTYKE